MIETNTWAIYGIPEKGHTKSRLLTQNAYWDFKFSPFGQIEPEGRGMPYDDLSQALEVQLHALKIMILIMRTKDVGYL